MHLFVGGWNLCICINSSFFNATYFPFRFNAVLKFTTVGGCKASFKKMENTERCILQPIPDTGGLVLQATSLDVNSDTALCSAPGSLFLFFKGSLACDYVI
jgi:hypothetical protein